jgi:prefoldin subunit 5
MIQDPNVERPIASSTESLKKEIDKLKKDIEELKTQLSRIHKDKSDPRKRNPYLSMPRR